LDPQVMPRRLWIAPRLIVLTVLGAVLFAPPPVNGQQVDRDPAVESGTALDLGQTIENQQRIIEEQGRRIDQLQRELEEIRTLLATPRITSPPPAATAPAGSDLQRKLPEIPPDLVPPVTSPVRLAFRAATPR
jgi:hypothetical protein